jgi:Na+-translocating ferredoxin:NAD+ oxidoreductase RnfG subunit/NAD-dependent dihydropyrimidine dehydrogenase PreA subunit
MKRRIIFIFLFLLLIDISLCVLFAQTELSDVKLKQVLPEADFFIYKVKPFQYYEGYKGRQKEKSELVGFAFSTYQLLPEEKGYNGPIDILVGMDLSGKLIGMKILKHRETPSYTAKIYSKKFQNQFMGKSVYKPMQIGVDIDAITRATITSEAIARTIRKSMRQVAGEILKFKNLPKEPVIFDEFKRIQIYLIILFLISAVGVFFSKRESLRWVILAVSFVYLGFIKGNFVSIVNFINLANLRLPSPVGSLYWYIFLIFVLIITLLWGRVYCGYICPFGIICAMLKRLPTQRLGISFALNRMSSYLKLLILAVLLLIYLLTKNDGLFNYEIFVTLFTLHRSYMAWLLLAISILAMLSVIPYFWCRFLCPAGGMLGIISKISLFKQRLKCPNPKCRECSYHCPMGCIDPDKKTIFFPECIRCNICINKCPYKNESR